MQQRPSTEGSKLLAKAKTRVVRHLWSGRFRTRQKDPFSACPYSLQCQMQLLVRLFDKDLAVVGGRHGTSNVLHHRWGEGLVHHS